MGLEHEPFCSCHQCAVEWAFATGLSTATIPTPEVDLAPVNLALPLNTDDAPFATPMTATTTMIPTGHEAFSTYFDGQFYQDDADFPDVDMLPNPLGPSIPLTPLEYAAVACSLTGPSVPMPAFNMRPSTAALKSAMPAVFSPAACVDVAPNSPSSPPPPSASSSFAKRRRLSSSSVMSPRRRPKSEGSIGQTNLNTLPVRFSGWAPIQTPFCCEDAGDSRLKHPRRDYVQQPRSRQLKCAYMEY